MRRGGTGAASLVDSPLNGALKVVHETGTNLGGLS
jgi:hypothetical protein